MADVPLKCPCPKCNRMLLQSGELTINAADGESVTVPTFQCDECLMIAKVMGEDFEMALTFAVDADGKPFDPAAEDGRLRF